MENLPLPGQENGSPLVRVNFGVADGHAAAETPPQRLGADGSVEWTNLIEFKVKKTNVLIFAVIFWKSTKQGESWTKFDDGRFDGPVVHNLPGVWKCTPKGPTGPSLYAELKMHEDGSAEDNGSSARPAPMIRSLAQRGSGSSGGFGNSGSYESFSRATSGSSSVYEDARDVPPATAAEAPGSWTPMTLHRARSEGVDDAPLAAPREEIPTVEGVPVVPSASGPVSSSRHRGRAERASWTEGISQAASAPSIRRVTSGGYLLREISARSRGRRSSSHNEGLSIPEELPPQPVDIPAFRSPVGTHRSSSLLMEDVPLQETKEGANTAPVSSTFTPMSRAREHLLMHSEPTCVPIQRQEGADAPDSSTAITMSHARARLISEGSQQPWIRPAFADPMHGRSGAGEDGRFAPAAGIEAEGLSKEMKTEERLSSFAAAGAAPSDADAPAGRKKGWPLKFFQRRQKSKKEEEPRPPIEDAQAEQSSPPATRTSRRPFSSATSATAEEVEEKETSVYRRMPARDGLVKVVRLEDRGAKTAQVVQSPERLRHDMPLQEARTPDEAEAEGTGVMVAAGSEGVKQAIVVAGESVESPSVVSSTEDLTGFDDTATYFSPPKPSAPHLTESQQCLRPELGYQSSLSVSDGEYEDDEDENVKQAKARSLLDASHAPYASGSMLQDSQDRWYSSGLIADDAQRRELPPNLSIKQGERNPPRAVKSSPRLFPADDKVIFDCFSPRAVAGGKTFELTIMAYLRQQRYDALKEMDRRAAVEASIPKAIPIMRNKRVTVKLVRAEVKGGRDR